MIKAVFFDVGGTLFSYRKLPGVMAQLIATLGQKLELNHEPRALLRHYAAANKAVDHLYADRPAYLFRDYFETVFLHFLERIESSHLHSHFDWFEVLLREQMIGCIELRDDCHDTLDRLKAMGLYLSVVSNADRNQLQPLIDRGQLTRWMQHCTSSEEAGSCKPDARIFQIALQKSGLAASEVLFVGDSPEQDIQGATVAGMRTALIIEMNTPAPLEIGREAPDPDFRITRLGELPAIVAGLRASAAAA